MNDNHEYKMISTKDLVVDDFYQREIEAKKLVRMVKNYNPCLVNAIKVSVRDGLNYVFDGRHTATLEKAVRGKGKDVMVECKVYHGLTRYDEAELFVKQNGEATQPKKAEKLRALYNKGDADVRGMVENAAAAGVIIDPQFKLCSGTSKIVAYATIQMIYVRFKAKERVSDYIRMLDVINRAWDGIAESFSREILKGMAKFFEVYGDEINDLNLIKSLSRVTPTQIVREGKNQLGGATATGYAKVILHAYNNHRSTNRLEDKL